MAPTEADHAETDDDSTVGDGVELYPAQDARIPHDGDALATPEHVSTTTGFTMPLPVDGLPDVLGRVMARVLVLGTVGMTTWFVVFELVRSPFLRLQLASVLPAIIGLFVVAWMLGLSYGLAMMPTMLLLAWHRRNREVRVEGRTVHLGRKRFTMGMPGQTLTTETFPHGARLLLKNDRESLTLRGPPEHLQWLREQLEAMAVLGGERDVPVSLRVLRGLESPRDADRS